MYNTGQPRLFLPASLLALPGSLLLHAPNQSKTAQQSNMHYTQILTSILAIAAGMISPSLAAEQSCTAGSNWLANHVWYSVWIDVPFNETVLCNDVEASILIYADITKFECVDDGDYDGVPDTTRLWFDCELKNGNRINMGLEGVYPMVDGFNCPDY